LAEISFNKFGLHLPLNRQSATFAKEGVDLDVSTMADWMGAVTVALAPMTALLSAHVLKGERLHTDETPVPVLARGKTRTGRLWVVVRDDRPFAGAAPPAATYGGFEGGLDRSLLEHFAPLRRPVFIFPNEV
jgi:transposase